jgi:predicted dehydrogenase
MHQLTGKVEKVGIDDACIFHCHFANGSLGLFESTRYARGHKALYTFEINGEHASIKWDLHDLNRLEYFDHADESKVRGWRSYSYYRWRSALYGSLVGAWPWHWLRTFFYTPGCGFSEEPENR